MLKISFQKEIKAHLEKRYSTKAKTAKFLKLDYPKKINQKEAIKALILRGMSNIEIQSMMLKVYRVGYYSLREISWQRSELIKQGFRVKSSRFIKRKGGVKWES